MQRRWCVHYKIVADAISDSIICIVIKVICCFVSVFPLTQIMIYNFIKRLNWLVRSKAGTINQFLVETLIIIDQMIKLGWREENFPMISWVSMP